jgi:CHAT domain-containing protein/tetratricopeptide (TPR) repeat protein
LTRPFDKHLDSDELDRLVSLQETSVSGSEQLSEPALREAQRHVESCQDCSRKVQRHRFVQSEILRMRVPRPSSITPECIGDADWLEVAAGLLPEAKTRELMKHAAQCGHCGPLLKGAAEAISDETTPTEEALLASLRSARPEWRKNMAATLRDSVRDRQQEKSWWRGLLSWPRAAFVVATLAAVVVAVWLGSRALRPLSADQLLAQAYTERRTLEVRIPGAKYAPMRIERSPGGSNLDKSPSLLKAEALIGENLRKHPNDPSWLQARARADLLDGNYESSIKSLQHALQIQPDSLQLLTDLASAYFERAEVADRAIDYGNAIESLGKVLAKSPDDPVALFNRALVSERMFLYTQAVDDLEHYLRIDRNGAWADDARRRLAAVQEKLRLHDKVQAEPLLEPTKFADVLRGSDEFAKAAIDQRVEDYLNLALIKWLPSAFPASGNPALLPNQPSTRNALTALAELQAKKHSDSWLGDFLGHTPSSRIGVAVEALSKARDADDAGDPSTAGAYAKQAAELFSHAGNGPGAMRAELEEVYAFQRSAHGDQCLRVLTPLRAHLSGKGYAWMEGQALLEGMACWGMMGDLQSSQRDAEAAVAATERSSYGALHLRSLAFVASLATEKGDEVSSWASNLAGIRRYWSGPYPRIRGYQFYADLADDAESAGHGHVARSLWLEATTAIALTINRSGEAMSRYRLATVSVMAGDTSTAETEFRKASQIFGSLPQDPAIETYEMDSEVALASLQANRGDVDSAMQKLNSVRPRLNQVADYHIAIDFHRTLGKLYLQKGDYGHAESAFWSAIRIGEWSAKSLHTDSDRLAWDRETGGAYRGLVSTYNLEHRDSIETLELWEWYRALPLRFPPPPLRLANPNSTQTVVPKLNFLDPNTLAVEIIPASLRNELSQLTNQTVLAFNVQTDGITIWDFDSRGVHSTWVPVSAEMLASVADRFTAECANPDSDVTTLRQDSRQLYRWLILPIESRLVQGQVLVVEPDGPIDDVSLQALMDDQSRYLGSRHPIVSSPGFWYQQQLRQDKPIDARNHTLVVGAPTASPEVAASLPPLPDAASEASSVASRFTEATLLTGTQATLARVQTEMPRAEVFHFAGHALNEDRYRGLLLANPEKPETGKGSNSPSLLNAANLHAPMLKLCQLAVLSACRTSHSDKPAMTDPDGLVRAFLHAKVPHIVATRWNVDSAISSVFVNAFYAGLFSGYSVSQATQSASLQVMNNPQTSHPYYWAAFSAFGRD